MPQVCDDLAPAQSSRSTVYAYRWMQPDKLNSTARAPFGRGCNCGVLRPCTQGYLSLLVVAPAHPGNCSRRCPTSRHSLAVACARDIRASCAAQRKVTERKHAPDGATPPGTAPLAPQRSRDGASVHRARRAAPGGAPAGSPALRAQSRARHRGIKINPQTQTTLILNLTPVGHALALAFSDGKPVRGAAGSSASRAVQGGAVARAWGPKRPMRGVSREKRRTGVPGCTPRAFPRSRRRSGKVRALRGVLSFGDFSLHEQRKVTRPRFGNRDKNPRPKGAQAFRVHFRA